VDYQVAEFVRFIMPDEKLEDLIDEAKAQTWIHQREYAAIVLDRDDVILVRGGRDGIELVVDSRWGIVVDVNGTLRPVKRLAWHTHPRPTGPSDHDGDLLLRLEQASSVVYEIGGDARGTIFVPKEGER
jgi:hypothetical protein